jgi:hypothetical protein
MKTTKLLYWVFTVLFSLLMVGSAIPDVAMMPDAVIGMHELLGYPLYFIPFIGVAKILGVIAILIPGYPRLKEWAYAGLCYDLIGATYSIFCVPMPGSSPFFMLIPLLVAACAYIFYIRKTRGDGKAVLAK